MSASCPGRATPRPITPMSASAPPWTTEVAGDRPRWAAAAGVSGPTTAPGASTSAGHLPSRSGMPSVSNIVAGKPPWRLE